MSQSRPRPRPKPRPAHPQASNAAPTLPPGPSSSSTGGTTANQAKSAREQELDEEDMFFLKNRNRTVNDWKKIDLREKEEEAQTPDASSDAEVDWGQPGGSSPRKKNKAGKKATNGLPNWTRTGSVSLLSSDSDDELEVIDGSGKRSNPNVKTTDGRSGKRSRSRSRSLTPPPELSFLQIQKARNVVRQTLQLDAPQLMPTVVSESAADESTDTIVLDPELEMISRAAREQRARSSDDMDGGTAHNRGGGPEDVTIKITWRPHPLNTAAQPEVWGFKLKRHHNFTALVEEVADMASVLSDNVILTFGGSRVFASATPHSLQVWAEAEMEACDKATFEYIRQHKYERASQPTDHDNARGRSPSADPGGDEDSDSDVESVAAVEDDTFKLIVRSASTKDVTLTVRPTTTCGAIVKAFLKRTGLADKHPEGKSRRKSVGGGPRLMVDGERMGPDTPISEADLEDGDQIEVAGV
ncbi:hypothetical protein EWM64_g4405 [Hericium alpestre]|uniref:Rad60/SUMO-like domain-containing protein n=1 Tax=Hericium alpestre TaxID=135208 RepID=A0A4Y9ZXT6_9AGAM|nr:hypothetical protein EWM64_g4405 [Hericium alpestre]